MNSILPYIVKGNNCKKFIDINDIIIYKSILLISSDSDISTMIDFKSFKNIDENLLHTGIKFIENDLNISKTSNALFLHRNTLIYRLEKIKELMNLDLKILKIH